VHGEENIPFMVKKTFPAWWRKHFQFGAGNFSCTMKSAFLAWWRTHFLHG
jgi:hypothetical protein